MSDFDIFEWTTGWAWPVIALLGVLIAWGIGRFIGWNEDQEPDEGHAAALGQACVCRCGGE